MAAMEREVLVLLLVPLLAVLAAAGPADVPATAEHRAAQDADAEDADVDFTGRGPSFGAASFLDFSRT